MQNKTFNIIIEQGQDGYLISSVIELHGCHTQAKSYDELMNEPERLFCYILKKIGVKGIFKS